MDAFSAMKGQYTRLGQMLGNSVVKWVVCPLKPIDNVTVLDQLDSSLGTEDELSRYYAKAAYSNWSTNIISNSHGREKPRRLRAPNGKSVLAD